MQMALSYTRSGLPTSPTNSESPVKKAFSKYQADQIEFGNPWDIWQQKVEELRSLIGKLINASKK